MVKQTTWAKQAGVTPAKLALIGVLAVMLGGVLYLQFGGTGATAPPIAVTPTVDAAPTVAESESNSDGERAVTPTSIVSNQARELGNWRPPEIASVVQYDPFALPASFPQPRQAELDGALAQNTAQTIQDAMAQRAALETERQQTQTQFEGMRQQGVHVIIKRGDAYVAIVGDEEIHVGDELDGFKVIAIDADGVRVAKDLSP